MATSYKYVKVKDGAGRGIMGLWRRGSQYYAQIDVPTPDGGKKTTKINLESSGVNEAKRKLEELKERIRSGKYLQSPKVSAAYTLKTYIDHYLSTVIKKPGTIFRERYLLNDWLNILGICLLIILQPMQYCYINPNNTTGDYRQERLTCEQSPLGIYSN